MVYDAAATAVSGSYCKPCFHERSKASYAKRIAEKHGRGVRVRRSVPEGHKYCPDCDAIKLLEHFPRNRSDSTGYAAYCKLCHNRRGREVKERLYGGNREYHLRRRYGIGQAEFDRLLAEQVASAPSAADPTRNMWTTITSSVTYVASCASTATEGLGSSRTGCHVRYRRRDRGPHVPGRVRRW